MNRCYILLLISSISVFGTSCDQQEKEDILQKNITQLRILLEEIKEMQGENDHLMRKKVSELSETIKNAELKQNEKGDNSSQLQALVEDIKRSQVESLQSFQNQVLKELEDIRQLVINGRNTQTQRTQKVDADDIESLRQEMRDQLFDLSNSFQQLMSKQDSIAESLSIHNLKLDQLFEVRTNLDQVYENAPNADLGPMLMSAIKNNNQGRVLALLESGASVEFQDSENNRPIHVSVENSNPKILKILLDHGADVNSRGKYSYTPLHWTAYNGCVECARILMEKQPLVDGRDTWQETPLIKSSRNGYDDLVQLLLENGADVNAAESAGFTPLHMASHYGHLSTAGILLNYGANLSLKTSGGYTAIDFAQNNNQEIESLLKFAMNRINDNRNQYY